MLLRPRGSDALADRHSQHKSVEDMSRETDNKAIVGRWFEGFWANPWNPKIIDELSAPDMLLQYSLHAPRRGREDVRNFIMGFREAFSDLNFWGTADLIAEGDYVVGRWEGGGAHTGPDVGHQNPATRKSANRIDIKITITPVAKTNRSADKRRIGVSLDEAVALGMVLRQRHVELAEGLFDRVHHHVRPADEVLVVGIRRRQVALEHLRGDEALLARPAGGRIRQHVDDRQVEPRLQRLQFLPEGDRIPVPAAVEQGHRPPVPAVGKGPDHAHHRGDADSPRDQHVHVRRVADGEGTVRPIEID